MIWRLKCQTLNFYKLIKIRVRRYSDNININDVCILSGARTPIGCFKRKLSDISAVELGAKALSAAIEKSSIDIHDIQELVLGNVFPTGCGQSLSSQIAISAGMPDCVVNSSVNKLCGSGLKAIINGCLLISTNMEEVVAVGGVESLSNVPYVLNRRQKCFGDQEIKDSLILDGLLDPFDYIDVTTYAEESVKEYNYKREDLDDFALESYSRAASAQDNNVFAAELVPVVVTKKKIQEVVSEDEEVKLHTFENFRNLRAELGKDGTITAGNASSLADGAAMLILASGNFVLKKKLKPLARIISYADAAVHRKRFCEAPAAAIQMALKKACLDKSRINVWEISETFAITSLLNAKLLGIDIKKVNLNGGSISLGHPFGMTGARLIVHLAHTLQPGMLGCASISHATGGGLAMIIEKL